MALRARLSAPRVEQDLWPWHQARWTEIFASAIFGGDRRFEASNYLAGGYGVRLAMEARKAGWTRLESLADVAQPPRLKGILVGKEFGVPFLNTTQAFALTPNPRKWLSLDKTPKAEARFSRRGDILLLASANVGRSMIATKMHENHIISHHFIRIAPKQEKLRGWLYAYLRAPQTRAMMSATQYGCIIKHLETSHLNALPMPVLRDGLLEEFNGRVKDLLDKRDRAHALLQEAEALFSAAIGPVTPGENPETGFSVKTSEVFGQSRRLEAAYHTPAATAILNHFATLGLKVEPLSAVTERVWWMTRFKRILGDGGVPFMSADELFSLNPPVTKRILLEQASNPEDFYVKAGWIVMARSGQTYGLNGSVALMTKKHESVFLSDDLIRIIPRPDMIRPGYLSLVLGHPALGRPLVIRHAYGTSIPHLDPADVAAFPVVRLGKALETNIADGVEEASALRTEADEIENNLAAEAEAILDGFMAGDTLDVVVSP